MDYKFDEVDEWMKGWLQAFRRHPTKALIYILGILLGLAFITIFLTWVAECGSHDNSSPVPASSWENGNLMSRVPKQPPETSDRMILPPTWIPLNGGHPILDGKGMITIHEYLTTQVELDVTLPGAKWNGKNPEWAIVGAGESRHFTWDSNRFVVNILTVESNRTQVSVTQLAK